MKITHPVQRAHIVMHNYCIFAEMTLLRKKKHKMWPVQKLWHILYFMFYFSWNVELRQWLCLFFLHLENQLYVFFWCIFFNVFLYSKRCCPTFSCHCQNTEAQSHFTPRPYHLALPYLVLGLQRKTGAMAAQATNESHKCENFLC